MEQINFFFQIAILLISIMAHEIAHGTTAFCFGDPTAKNQNRLSLNPLRHIDLVGSILLPLFLYITSQITGAGFIFGWAKPVPYNPYNLRKRRLGEFCVAISGIVTNFFIAGIFSTILHFVPPYYFSQSVVDLIVYIIFLNVTLGVFNLIPVPPLDGSKILFSFIPYKYERNLFMLERFGFFLLIILIVFFGPLITELVYYVTNLLI